MKIGCLKEKKIKKFELDDIRKKKRIKNLHDLKVKRQRQKDEKLLG